MGRERLVHALRAGALAADVVVDAGMVVASLRHYGEELLDQRRGLEAYRREGATMGVPLLYPWANRLSRERFVLRGRAVDATAAARDPATGLPIHGLPAARRGWRVAEAGPRIVRGVRDWDEAAFPFDHRLALAVSLDEGGLRVAAEVTGDAPIAFGFHPYLVLPGEPRAEWHVELPVRRRIVLDERRLPTGERVAAEPYAGPLGERTYDDAFEAPTGPFVLAGRRRRIAVRFEHGFACSQVFAPADDDVIAFEPMTAPTDALVTGDGLGWAPHAAAFRIDVA